MFHSSSVICHHQGYDMEPHDWFTCCINQARRIVAAIDLDGLPSMRIDRPEFAESLPRVTAVYFIFGKGKKPLYIGRATNLMQRWSLTTFAGSRTPDADHHRLEAALELGNATLRWLEVPSDELGITEMLLIQAYKPKWNKQRS